jgi:AcrR family transcriptional regulator
MGIKERKEREKERRRQDIMVAARRVFSIKGYEKATVEDIAKESELSPGTLYLYFKNKGELYASLSIRVLQFINIKLEHAVLNEALTYEEKLDALVNVMWESYEFDALTLNNTFHLQSSDALKKISPELLSQLNDLARKVLHTLSHMFSQEIKKGTIVQHNPMALADIVWGIFSGVILWEESKRILNEERFQLKESIQLAIEIFGNGLKADPA